MIGLLLLLGIALALLLALLVTMLAWQMVHPPRHTAGWALARGLPCDPNDLKLTFEEWWLDRPGGVRLPVWEVETTPLAPGSAGGAMAGNRNGLTAIFVHGWGHSRVDSLQRIGPFLPLVDRIVLYDLRGHGEATGGPSALGDGEDDDLLALIDELGDGPILLVGHSMGAVIALHAAAKSSRQHSAVGNQRSGSSEIAGVIAYASYGDFHRSLRGRLRVHEFPSRPLTDLALLVHRMRGVRPGSLTLKNVREVNVPTLVIHGVEDRVAPLQDARSLAKAMPQATLLEIDGGAHADAHSIDQTRHDEAVRGLVERISTFVSGPVA